MKKFAAILLSIVMAVPVHSLFAQQISPATAQQPSQVAQAGTNTANAAAPGATAATSAAIAGIGLAGLIAIGVLVAVIAVGAANDDDTPITASASASGTR